MSFYKGFTEGFYNSMMKEDNRSIVEARNLELENLKQSLELQLTEMANKVKEANLDPLTGLRNRRGIQEEIDKYLKDNEKGSLFIMDLDNFKSVNDTYGHIEGDMTLKRVARALEKLSKDKNILSRLGGDEFIIFITDFENHEDLKNQAKEVIKRIEKDVVNPGRLTKITTSLGIAVAPADGRSFEELYNHSDLALYESKHRGKNRYSFYEDILITKSRIGSNKASLNDIIKRIGEKAKMEGSYLVDYDNFEKIYRFIERNMSRENREVQCVLLSLDEIDDEKMLKIQTQHLQELLVAELRKGDVITRYSDSQMLMLLMDTNKDNAQKVIDRVLEKYRMEEKELALDVTFELSRIQGEEAVS